MFSATDGRTDGRGVLFWARSVVVAWWRGAMHVCWAGLVGRRTLGAGMARAYTHAHMRTPTHAYVASRLRLLGVYIPLHRMLTDVRFLQERLGGLPNVGSGLGSTVETVVQERMVPRKSLRDRMSGATVATVANGGELALNGNGNEQSVEI